MPWGQAELRGVQRCMRYCRSLRERKAAAQAAVLRGMGVDAADIRVQKPLAGVLKPSYVIVRDRQLHAIVLAIRGTHSLKVGLSSRGCRPLMQDDRMEDFIMRCACVCWKQPNLWHLQD